MRLPVDNVVASPTDVGRPRIVVAGLSPVGTCGVRDHAGRLTDALHESGAQVSTVWVDHGDEPLAPVRLAAMLGRACRQTGAEVVLLHYSVFAYSWRGIPVAVPALALGLRRLGVPVVLFAHEFAYPWGKRGWRGAILSLTQRLAFAPLVAASAAIIVTTEGRATWVRGRRWLPRRQLASAPVFANVSAPAPDEATRAVPGRVGVFSFGAEGLLIEVVVEAVAEVHRSDPDTHLRLIGSPGPDSPAGRRLRQLADRVGCPVSFSGLVGEEQLSHELSSCDVIFHTDPAGPTSRKTTLAAALSHGRPVLAFDGPHRWQELADAGAVELVPADARVAAALEALLQDPPRKAALAQRACEFAAARLSPKHTASTVLGTIRSLTDERGNRRRSSLALHRFGFNRGSRRIVRLPQAVVKAALLSQQVTRAAPNQRARALTKWWQWQALRRIGRRPVTVDFEGYALAIPRWSQIGGMIIGAGTHERNETNILDALIRNGDVFIDVGANIGYYAVRYAAAGATVLAVDPVDKALAALQHSLDLNGLSENARTLALALSDSDGTARFDDTGDVTNHIGGSIDGRLVETRRLDNLGPSIPVPGPDGLTVLKIDAEGHDIEVLQGGREFLARRRPIVMCEAWAGGDPLRQILSEADYRLFLPARQELEPLPHQFDQANVIGVPAELMSEVTGRLDRNSWTPVTSPTVRSWGLS